MSRKIVTRHDLSLCVLDPTYDMERIICPRDKTGYEIAPVCLPHRSYIQYGHLLEALIEFLIFIGETIYGKVKVFEGRPEECVEITNIDSYLNQKINRGSANGVSDVTFEKDKIRYYMSCKYYYEEKSMNNYDVEDIYANIKRLCKVDDNKFVICLCIKDKKSYNENFARTRNIFVTEVIDPVNVIDKKDIFNWISALRRRNIVNVYDLFDPKPFMSLHIHQEIIAKTLYYMISNKSGRYLLGAMHRS